MYKERGGRGWGGGENMIVRVVVGGRENNNLICVFECSLTQLIFSIVFLFSKGRRGQLARFVFDFCLNFHGL